MRGPPHTEDERRGQEQLTEAGRAHLAYMLRQHLRERGHDVSKLDDDAIITRVERAFTGHRTERQAA